MLADGHGLLDHQVHADHVSQHGVLLRAEDVIELLVDLREVVGDLVHRLLHRQLRHDPGRTRQNGRVRCNRARTLRDLDPLLDLARLPHHRVAEVRPLLLDQAELADRFRRLLGQLNPAPGVRGDLGAGLHAGGADAHHLLEARQTQIL